jgi:hypothetical protein
MAAAGGILTGPHGDIAIGSTFQIASGGDIDSARCIDKQSIRDGELEPVFHDGRGRGLTKNSTVDDIHGIGNDFDGITFAAVNDEKIAVDDDILKERKGIKNLDIMGNASVS